MGAMRQVAGALGLALSCAACGGGDDGESDEPSGTVTEEWRDFCVATFTEDYRVIDVFDEPEFEAKAGDEYLLSSYSDSFGPEAEMIFLWPHGPEPFEVTAITTADFPFTTACPLNTAAPYYAVFDDVSVYAEESLTTKLCDLAAGTALPRTNEGSGYSAVTLNFSGPNTFEVILNAFSAQCGGAPRGYVSVPQVESFGSTRTWLVPILGVLHP
jgi:hypothetical protein